jgi:transposase-like protein
MSNDQNENSSRIKNVADELPPPDTERWTPQRKATVVDAVRSGLNTTEEVCRRYDLTVEEFLWWQNLMQRRGYGVCTPLTWISHTE